MQPKADGWGPVDEATYACVVGQSPTYGRLIAEGSKMAKPHIHYEAAFEDFVRSRGWPYLPVDESRKTVFAGTRVKSFDFLVYPPGKRARLVDVKGRKFPYEGEGGKRYWENWVTRDDLDGLRRWGDAFGEEFVTGLVFAYWLLERSDRDPTGAVHVFRNQCYAFLWISTAQYAVHARMRSPKWDTVSMPCGVFRRLARPVGEGAEIEGTRERGNKGSWDQETEGMRRIKGVCD